MSDVLILNAVSTSHKYTVRLEIKGDAELRQVRRVLEPLGFRFRFPKR